MIDEKKLLEKLNTWCDALSPETDIGDSIKCDVIDTVIMMIRNTKKVGEWIPVSERLPDVGVNVLVTYKDDDNNLAIDTDYRDKIINDWLYFGDDVTAWQPLPEPCREKRFKWLYEDDGEERDGCDGCKYEYKGEDESPCTECSMNYTSKWERRPKKTRQDEFLEMFPNAKKREDILTICPDDVDVDYNVCESYPACKECKRDYWLQEWKNDSI